jgi:hypothetical protein
MSCLVRSPSPSRQRQPVSIRFRPDRVEWRRSAARSAGSAQGHARIRLRTELQSRAMPRIHEIAGEVRCIRNPNRNGTATTGRGRPGAARLSIRVCASVCSSDEQGARRQTLEMSEPSSGGIGRSPGATGAAAGRDGVGRLDQRHRPRCQCFAYFAIRRHIPCIQSG